MDGIKTYSQRNNQVEEDVMEENLKDPVSEATNLEGVNAREEKTVVNEATMMDFTKADCLQLQSQMNGQFVFLNEQLRAQMLHINKILEPINKFISSSYQKLEEFTHKNITEINGTQIIIGERLAKIEGNQQQLDKNYASKTSYTKLENRVAELERRVAGQQSEFMEVQKNNMHNESAYYNNWMQSKTLPTQKSHSCRRRFKKWKQKQTP